MGDLEQVKTPAELVADAVVDWAAGQPLWKQEAMRRVLRKTHSIQDVQDVVDALLSVPDDPPFEITALDRTELAVTDASEAVQALLEIRDVQNVNRLAVSQRLKLGDSGLTVVYGHNGAGKSGYARILKRACGARDAEQIIGDAYTATGQHVPATARLDVRVNGQEVPVSWKDHGPDSRLTGITIFDTKTAPFFVEKKGGLAYVPFGLDVFERLCSLLDDVRAELARRIEGIRVQCSTPISETPLSPETTDFLDNLGAKSDEEVGAFLQWTDSEDEVLASLGEAVADPLARLKKLEDAASKLWTTLDEFDEIIAGLDDPALSRAQQLVAKEKSARLAAEAAATGAFPQDPLAGTGDSIWRTLYDAAERYSVEVAYQGRDFPPAEEQDRCVLCQQELNTEARDRLRRFRAFVSGEAAATASRLAEQRRELRERYVQLQATLNDMVAPPLLASEHREGAATFESYRSAAHARVGVLVRVIDGQDESSFASWPTKKLSEVRIILGRIRDEEAELGRLIAAGKADELAVRAGHYRSRKSLSLAAEQVRQRHVLQRASAKINAAMELCGTLAISRFGGELIKRNVTERLETAFDNQKKALRVDTVPVRLSATAKKGAVERFVGLEGVQGKISAGVVLSEGEHRAVALAAFLAEMEVSGGLSPIILDDPVSSLDHLRRTHVATRMAEAAKNRQVIIFTHDLPFLLMLEEVCGTAQIALTRVFLERGAGGFGVVSSEPAPWDAQKLGERKHKLRELVAKAKKHHGESGDDEHYHGLVTTFYDRLRKTWERSLEELVFRDAVRRYRPSVETKRLLMVVFDDEIFVAYERGMTAASKLTGHDQASGLGGTLPLPDDLEALMDQLDGFDSLIKAKSTDVEARRKALIAPSQAGQVGSGV